MEWPPKVNEVLGVGRSNITRMEPETKELWSTIIRHVFGIVKALETWVNKH